MRTLHFAVVLIVTLAFSPKIAADPLRAGHPLVGTWKVNLRDFACSEVYRIRADGTSLVTSADEIAELELAISDQPSAKGYYKWVDRIVKDNGKKDCAGAITPVGQTNTIYIRLHSSGDMFLMCEAEDINTCMGPFVRVAGGNA